MAMSDQGEALISAYAWFNLAASAGSNEARRMKQEVATRMSVKQIEAAQRLSGSLL